MQTQLRCLKRSYASVIIADNLDVYKLQPQPRSISMPGAFEAAKFNQTRKRHTRKHAENSHITSGYPQLRNLILSGLWGVVDH